MAFSLVSNVMLPLQSWLPRRYQMWTGGESRTHRSAHSLARGKHLRVDRMDPVVAADDRSKRGLPHKASSAKCLLNPMASQTSMAAWTPATNSSTAFGSSPRVSIRRCHQELL